MLLHIQWLWFQSCIASKSPSTYIYIPSALQRILRSYSNLDSTIVFCPILLQKLTFKGYEHVSVGIYYTNIDKYKFVTM